ncbi:MAG: hypothetical protein F4Z51_03705 [Chloroflexi bacterium]|nr:hypothetical protein [Chloroflexota bacterium]MYD16198.1 hypothetical protein [Chloroflexota bacterium]
MLIVATALPWEAQTARAGAAIAGRQRVRLITSGIGPVRARNAAEQLFDTTDSSEITAVLSVGVAGGLTNDMRHPALTLPTPVVRQSDHAQWDLEGPLYRKAQWTLNQTDFYWRPAISITTPHVLFTRPEKVAAAATGAQIVQMEDSEWAEVCASKDLPFIALRVVLDALDDDIPVEFGEWRRDVPTAMDIAMGAIRRPRLLRELAQLGLQRRAALQELERALTVLIPGLAPN